MPEFVLLLFAVPQHIIRTQVRKILTTMEGEEDDDELRYFIVLWCKLDKALCQID